MNGLSGLYPLLLAVIFILTNGEPTYAALFQQDNPVAQCEAGSQLFLEGQAAEALPLVEAGFTHREQATFAGPDDLGFCALTLGVLRHGQDDLSGALEAYHVALKIFQASGNRGFEAATLHNIGQIYDNQEQYAEAMENYQRALAIDREIGDRAMEGFTLASIGTIYNNQGKYAEALKNYQQSLVIRRELGDRANEGITLTNMGTIYHSQGQYAEALSSYQQALAINRELNDRAGEGQSLGNIGGVYHSQGRYAKALDSYQQALAILQEVGDRAGEGQILSNIATVYDSQGRYAKALDSYQQALTINRELGDRAGEGQTLSYIGSVYDSQGRYVEALDIYQHALAINREVGDRAGEGVTLNNLGMVYSAQGRFAEALDNLQQSLIIRREVSDRAGEGITLANIGTVYNAQGRSAEALDSYQQALIISREIGDRVGEGEALSGIGTVYYDQGRYAEALDSYQQALAIRREIGDRAQEGFTLSQIGKVYDAQGRPAEALDNYQQALVIHREVGDRVGEGFTLTNIGAVYADQGRSAEALDSFQQALVIHRQGGNRVSEGVTLNNMGAVYAAQGQYAEALDSYQQALLIRREVGDRAGEGATLTNIGVVHYDQGDYAEALESYQQALVVLREVGDRAGEGITLANIGAVYSAQGQPGQAVDSYRQAIVLLETIRATAGSEAGRAGFIAQHISTYQALVDLLHQQGQDEEAFFITEQGRARAFLDALATGQVQLSDNATADLLAREQELYAQRQAIQDNLATARAQNPPAPDLVSDLEKQLAQANTDYTAIQAKIAAHSDQLADLIPSRNRHVLTVAGVQALLNPQTTLLSYYLLEDKTLAFLLTRDSSQVIELPISQEELTKKVNALRKFLDTQTPDVARQHLQELYQRLITPLNEAERRGGEGTNNSRLSASPPPRLIIVPHGVLHYLPFAALLDLETDEYLLQQYELVMLPSASALQFVMTADRRPPTEQPPLGTTAGEQEITSTSSSPRLPASPLIVGNPKTGDFDATASLAAERAGLASLPFAEAEARAIAALYGVEPLIGEAATESAVREKAAEAGILHLAAHGFYNSAAPLSSFIALAPDPQSPTPNPQPLSSDGWLTVGEVYGLNLQQTDLVVLSACQTQLGELKTVEGKVQLDVTAGDDVVGLTRSFLFAGTPTVVATLWNVNDEATQLLMERFYRHLKEGASKAEALRQAQMELVEYDNGRYADPYYWAAFVLSGDGGETSQQPGLISVRLGNKFITGGLLVGVVGVIIVAWVLWRRARKESHP